MNVGKYLNEALKSSHIKDRLVSRIKKFNDVDISNKKEILDNIEKVFNHKFDKKDYAIRVGVIDINIKSKYYYTKGDKKYYRIFDFLGKDSTGNEIWLIVRSNRLITVMLRKDIQPYSKMRVDNIISEIENL